MAIAIPEIGAIQYSQCAVHPPPANAGWCSARGWRIRPSAARRERAGDHRRA